MDPYVYPGTNVLKNLRDIRDPDSLAKFEGNMTTRRLIELSNEPAPGRFDAAHLKAIHRYIFQDVFDWAGEFRTVNIGKSGTLFALAAHIDVTLSQTFTKLHAERYLDGADFARFCARAAFFLGEINAIHPFREGNGRTQREFIRQLALRGGFATDWSRITREQMIEASQRSFKGDYAGLEQLLKAALSV